jgi:hypothetical protein
MQKAWATLGLASGTAGVAIFYAHYSQVTEKKRMHAGVLNDILKERAAAEVAAAPVCESGVCDLSQTRFRDPKSGQVYSSTPVS